jgi:hypothetical protein
LLVHLQLLQILKINKKHWPSNLKAKNLNDLSQNILGPQGNIILLPITLRGAAKSFPTQLLPKDAGTHLNLVNVVKEPSEANRPNNKE